MTRANLGSTSRGYRNRIDVLEGVRDALCEALGVKRVEVIPTARIMADLGAESLDFLEIIFRLEKVFGFKIPRGELIPSFVIRKPEFMQGDKVSPTGIAELKRQMRYSDLSEFEKDPRADKFGEIYTVRFLVEYVSRRLMS